MLTGLLCFLAVLPITLGIDWLVCTRIGAYQIDYEYSYRPSVVRYALLALLAAIMAYGYANHDPAGQPISDLNRDRTHSRRLVPLCITRCGAWAGSKRISAEAVRGY